MPAEGVSLLHDGYFDIDLGMLVYLKGKYYGKTYRAALKPMLVRSEGANILIDTGICDLPEPIARFYNVQRNGRGIVHSLKAHTLEPLDIDLVINTHLHVDHAGNNRLFRNARFIVQARELEFAHNPTRWMRGGYLLDAFSDMEFDEIDGDRVVMEGVRVILTGGHTPGHQAVVVETDAGRYIYCGDIAPLKENLERMNITGILYSPVDAYTSLENLASIDGVHIFSHDNQQMALRE